MNAQADNGPWAKTLLGLVGVIFAVAFVVMILPMPWPDERMIWTPLIRAGALALVIAPTVYLVWLRPLRNRPSPVAGEAAGNVIDAQTHTLNRHGVTVSLLELMAMADRYHHRLSVALLKLDTGAEDVAEIAARIADALRMPDRLGRYDEGTFLLLFPETEFAAAQGLVERIQGDLAGTGVRMATSVTAFAPGEDLQRLLLRVEQGLASD